jgi:hypothetical protein
MTATQEQWMSSSVLPRGSSYETMLEFFGIPPYTADKLDENIGKKRRDWYAKTSSGNPRGRHKAKEVVTLIQRLSETLKRGAPGDVGGGAAAEIPDSVFQTLEDLWRLISEYVFADDYDRALQAAREAVSRWGMTPGAASVLAWVVATGCDTGNIAHPALLQEGMDAAEVAVRGQPEEPRNWESKISLLLASARVPDAITTTDEAKRSLSHVTARLYMLRVRAVLSQNRAEDAVVAAVRAVQTAESDPDTLTAVRSQTTSFLVEWLAANLLPVKSAADLSRYVEMVDVAAWCSYGVPEAEDLVRVHRMWATNAGQRVFVGSWKLRSFFAVCTGFISLPIHNWMRSQPAWRVFIDGLQQENVTIPFAIVAGPQYVQRAHNMRLAVKLDDM